MRRCGWNRVMILFGGLLVLYVASFILLVWTHKDPTLGLGKRAFTYSGLTPNGFYRHPRVEGVLYFTFFPLYKTQLAVGLRYYYIHEPMRRIPVP